MGRGHQPSALQASRRLLQSNGATAPTTLPGPPTNGAAMRLRDKTGYHHCKQRDARGTTHRFHPVRCIKEHHMGYCPFCLIMTQYKAGCRTHGCNKEDLLTELPVNKDELLEKHKAQGLIGPPAKVRAVMAKLGLKTSEGFSDEEIEAEEPETDQVVEDARAVASPRGRAVAGGGLDDALKQLRMVSLEKAAHTDSAGQG